MTDDAVPSHGARLDDPTRDPTPLATLHRVWRQVAPDDRRRFLVEMLTPNERRAIQLGWDDAREED